MSRSLFRNTNPKLRVVGVDDGAFPARRSGKRHAILAAVLFDNLHISALRVGLIEVDGRDATHVLESLLRGIRFHVVMLSGISFGGFNLIDIAHLARATRRPVIAISGEKPDNAAVLKALRTHFWDWEERWRIVRSAGRPHSFKPHPKEPQLYFEITGGSSALARKMIASAAIISRLPEPIRVARILARGLSTLP